MVAVKNQPANTGDARDKDFIPELGRPPGAGNGNPLRYSCLENPMDRGAWWATVHRITRNQTRLKWLGTHSCVAVRSCISQGSPGNRTKRIYLERKKKKKERTFDVRDFPVLVEESGKFKLCRVSQQAGDSERNWFCSLSAKAGWGQNFFFFREPQSFFFSLKFSTD